MRWRRLVCVRRIQTMERRVLPGLVKSQQNTYRVPQRVRGHKWSILGLQQHLKHETDLRVECNRQSKINTTRHGIDTYKLETHVTIAAPSVTVHNITHFFHLGKFFGSHGSSAPSKLTTVYFSPLDWSASLFGRSFCNVGTEVVDIVRQSDESSSWDATPHFMSGSQWHDEIR